VNLTSRLEGANKEYGSLILVGPNTAEAAGETFELREIDRVRVKGKARAIMIFELQGEKVLQNETRQAANRLFAQGRRLYRERRWVEAAEAFEKALAADPADGPAAAFLKRCRAFERTPPEESWDGVFDMASK
jgi:adenylate cyclase